MNKPQSLRTCIGGILLLLIPILLGFALILSAGIVLENLNLEFPRTSNASLLINVLPAGSDVLLNGTASGVTPLNLSLQPGRYKLRITRSSHIPYETNVVLRAGQRVTIEYHLHYMTNVQYVASEASLPLWENSSTLFYVNMSDSAIMQYLLTGEKKKVVETPGLILSLENCLNYILVQHYASEDLGMVEEILAVEIDTGKVFELGMGDIAPMPVSEECESYLLGLPLQAEVGDANVWRGGPDGLFQPVSLEDLSNALPAQSIAWSADGQWFQIQSSESVHIWHYDGTVFTYASQIEPAFDAVWSPNGAHLVYMHQDGTIYYVNNPEKPDQRIVSPNGMLPLRWMPDGKQVVFTTYNPTNGGSAFWAVDVETGNRTLLADSSMILGRVTDFAISPDGFKIAYINDIEQLWILFLGE